MMSFSYSIILTNSNNRLICDWLELKYIDYDLFIINKLANGE